jgi:sugar (pentulose or hexulose) kinase
MSASRRIVAVDLGASSGRVMVARVGTDPDVLELDEVHRFPNGGVRAHDGSLRWDIERIWREVLEGLRLAGESGPVDGIGIDSWAVDYGLLDGEGRLLGAPYSHRDERTEGIAEKVVEQIGADELYAVTGIQRLPFNTLYQLVAETPERLTEARTMLLLPDLLAFWLSGEIGAERTNASTTQFLDATSRAWDTELLERLDLPTELLPELREPGEVVGTLLPEVAEKTGLPASVPVIAVGSHDTASAVVGVPAAGEDFAYISSGTWSLAGLELATPVLTENARRANFTNEGGVDATTRLLTNITGLWVLSECVRQWQVDDVPDSGLETVLAGAADLPTSESVFDIDDPSLLAQGDMPARVARLVGRDGSPAQTTRLILDSLAVAYRHAIRTACDLAGVAPSVLHVVGGGSENRLLCQLTADACELPVVAGPKEAAALGNVLVQARTLGVALPDLDAMRGLLRRTQSLTRYEPVAGGPWAQLEKYLEESLGLGSTDEPVEAGQ